MFDPGEGYREHHRRVSNSNPEHQHPSIDMEALINDSRRHFIGQSTRLAFALGAGMPLLQACGGGESTDPSGSATSVRPESTPPTNLTRTSSPASVEAAPRTGIDNGLDPIKDGLEPEPGPLRIVNYAEYVNSDVIADFEKLYGVRVEITTITTATEMATKLLDQSIKVDLSHSLSPSAMSRFVPSRTIQPLNKSYLPNMANVLTAFNSPWYDVGATYTAPYTFYGTGIGFRADRIDPAEVAEMGWDTIWNATQFKGQVSILDDEREAFAMSMLRRGLTDVNTLDQKLIDDALADVMRLIDLVDVKVNGDAYKDIPEGRTTVAQTWSADLITGSNGYLPEGTESTVLGFWHPPSELYAIGNDLLAIAARAENPVLAHHYINYILDNEVAEKNFGYVGYLPALTKLDADYVIGAGYVPEHLRNCVPTNEDIANGLVFRDLGIGDLQYEDAWAKFQAAR